MIAGVMEAYTLFDFVCNYKPCYLSLVINRLLLLLLLLRCTDLVIADTDLEKCLELNYYLLLTSMIMIIY